MLSIISEAPVNTLEDSGLVDVALARRVLRDASIEIQSRGWSWNTDRNVRLARTVDKIVHVPADALHIDAEDPNTPVVPRAGKLWNPRENTFEWELVPPLKIVRFLGFSDIPAPAQTYLILNAGRIFADRVISSEKRSGLNKTDELRAWVTLLENEAEQGDFNLAQSSPVSGLGPRWPTTGGVMRLL